jgi:hypothetical protein
LTAKKNMSIRPSQKTGADCPIRDNTFADVSSRDPRRTAERTPRGIPTTTEKRKETTPNWRVAGSRSLMASMTGRPST